MTFKKEALDFKRGRKEGKRETWMKERVIKING